MPAKPKRYLIDSDSFMQGARKYYSFDIARPLWDKLVQYGEEGLILSIDKVLKEINEGEDELKKWANSSFKKYFVPSYNTPEVISAHKDVINWANSRPNYTQAAKDVFLDVENADAFLVAFAKVHDCIVVTFEASRPASKNRVMIPDACHAANVECCDIFTMLKGLGFRF